MTGRSDPHDVFAELAAGYALYALEPEDEQTFLAHLPGCAECERDVAQHGETLTHLAYAADEGEPPAAVLDGIRAGVRASGPASTPDAPASLAQARTRRDRRGSRPLMRRAATWTGAAAALALVASLALWNTALQRDQELTDGTLETIIAALADEDTRTVPLQKPDSDDVLAVALVDDGKMSLVMNGLDPNDAQATDYVLWGRNDLGGVRPVSSFDVTGPSHQVVKDIPLDDEMTAFMVTREEGDTPPPVSTQPLLAVGEV